MGSAGGCGTLAGGGGGGGGTAAFSALGELLAVARGGGRDVVGCGAFGNGVLIVWVQGSTEWPGLAGDPKKVTCC